MVSLRPPYEIRVISHGNMGMFATRDIKKYELILREEPIYTTDKVAFFTAADPPELTDPKQGERLQMLKTRFLPFLLENGSERQAAQPLCRYKCPQEMRDLHDEIYAYMYERDYHNLSEYLQKAWLSLHDGRPFLPKDRSSPVGIDYLTSEKGKLLNGTIGNTVAPFYDVKTDRWTVEVRSKDDPGGEPERVKLKIENLKTPTGCYRSNAFDVGTTQGIAGKNVSRVNHACVPNAGLIDAPAWESPAAQALRGETAARGDTGNRHRSDAERVLFAKGPIKKGEEITISYNHFDVDTCFEEPRGSYVGALRHCIERDNLEYNYGFWCHCEFCAGQSPEMLELSKQRLSSELKKLGLSP